MKLPNFGGYVQEQVCYSVLASVGWILSLKEAYM